MFSLRSMEYLGFMNFARYLAKLRVTVSAMLLLFCPTQLLCHANHIVCAMRIESIWDNTPIKLTKERYEHRSIPARLHLEMIMFLYCVYLSQGLDKCGSYMPISQRLWTHTDRHSSKHTHTDTYKHTDTCTSDISAKRLWTHAQTY